ncbi:YgfZ/GcvT domain-containing protein [Sphingomonas sp. GlSt437]|uniref:CAF17-like 4Fe-4S cluster assembly/insertion protein YgfZ n=1 Tax=Sphingomonas sp. GlSt437 TaxID=3389970 RepID=UPI003A867B70
MSDTSPATLLDDRALIRVSGDDPRAFLNGLVTNDVATLAPDRPLWAGLLTPQGKALFDFILWDNGDAVLIDCAASSAELLARRLAVYRLRRAIAIEPVADLGVHWGVDREHGVADPRLQGLGRRWLGPKTGESAAAAWRAHRLSLGVTEGVDELGSDKTLWLEANADLLNGVSFAKGCYVGQENTARMHYRAKVNRRLVVAPISEASERTRASYEDLGIMVELRRIEALGDALMPSWLVEGIQPNGD